MIRDLLGEPGGGALGRALVAVGLAVLGGRGRFVLHGLHCVAPRLKPVSRERPNA